MKVAVVKESAPGERRVALVPETVPRLTQAGLEVLVEAGPATAPGFPTAPTPMPGRPSPAPKTCTRRRTSSSR